MNASAAALVAARREGGLRRTAADWRLMAWRNGLTAVRRPNVLVSGILFPSILLCLMVGVFSGSIVLPGAAAGLAFVDYLAPSIVLQSAVFTAMTAAGSMAVDLEAGVMDRLRSLPIARSAVLGGRVVDCTARTVLCAGVVLGVAVALGFRFRAGALPAVGFMGIAVVFGFAWSWYGMLVALILRSFDAVAGLMFLTFFPLFFLGGAFVPVAALPGWLQPVGNVNPLTAVTGAMRALALGGPTTTPVLQALGWSAAIALLCGSAAINRFRRGAA